MTVDMRLATKGGSEPRRGLVQQGNASVELAKKYATELAASGWSAEDTAGLEKNIARLELGAAKQADERGTARGASSAEQRAIDESKTFIRLLRNALPRALREANLPDVTAALFRAGGPLGRSTPKISDYLNRIRPSVAKLDKLLAKHFKGASASELLDKTKAALDQANATQEVALAGLPQETLQVYEAKGWVLEGIEDLNRAGKSAFDGQAQLAGQFNKDILLRARREARQQKGGEAPVDG